jgi:hypothetical protein
MACLIFTLNGISAIPDTTFLPYADSLFNSKVDSATSVKIIHNKHTFFLVTTCKEIPVNYQKVSAALETITHYHQYFKFMKRSEFLRGMSLGDSVAYFEVGVAYYVAWYAGYITKESSGENKESRYICGNLDQRVFKDNWDGKIGGLIRIRSHYVYLEWHLRDQGNGHTRVALTAIQAPVVYIPGWLLRIGAGSIFPGMVSELERYIKSQ